MSDKILIQDNVINSVIENFDDIEKKLETLTLQLKSLEENLLPNWFGQSADRFAEVSPSYRNDTNEFLNVISKASSNLSSYLSDMHITDSGAANLWRDLLTSELNSTTLTEEETEKLSTNSRYKYNNAKSARQGAPKETSGDERKQLENIIRKYYPFMSSKGVDEYLHKLSDEGCGYAAIANSIMDNFEGTPEEFEKTFGFPMYDENGNKNYNLLMTDFYAATDNHNPKKDKAGNYIKDENGNFIDFIDYTEDSKAFFNDKEHKTDAVYDPTYGKGTNWKNRPYRANMYLKEHGIDATYTADKNTCKDPITKIPDNMDVFVSTSNKAPTYLYDENGNLSRMSYTGGHIMRVKDVTNDGKYIVDSWGKEFVLDPDECQKHGNNLQYDYITYKKSDPWYEPAECARGKESPSWIKNLFS